GGAHGQNEKTFFVLDTGLGSQVFLDDILQSGARPSLQARIDDSLRETYGAAPGASLRTAGFLEDSGGVPENFFLSPDGLGFSWKPYEIAPYAMGAIEIVLPYTLIEDLLNDRGRNLFKNF
ncbi:MAG: RsiV family protein, partial [Spirochaetaceae bacterium]|nr:RsiV family protein [Spirochaetaceae bacterium]